MVEYNQQEDIKRSIEFDLFSSTLPKDKSNRTIYRVEKCYETEGIFAKVSGYKSQKNEKFLCGYKIRDEFYQVVFSRSLGLTLFMKVNRTINDNYTFNKVYRNTHYICIEKTNYVNHPSNISLLVDKQWELTQIQAL